MNNTDIASIVNADRGLALISHGLNFLQRRSASLMQLQCFILKHSTYQLQSLVEYIDALCAFAGL